MEEALFFFEKYWLTAMHMRWLVLMISGLSGCASPSFDLHKKQPYDLCRLNITEGNRKGSLLLELRTDWRTNQKEPQQRLQMAERVLLNLVLDQQETCLGLVTAIQTHNALYQFSDGKVDRRLLKVSEIEPGQVADGFRHNFDIHLVLIMEELGPHLLLSFPVLWSGYSEVSLQVQAFDPGSGKKLYQDRFLRRIGGPFQLHFAEQSGDELEWLLAHLLYSI